MPNTKFSDFPDAIAVNGLEKIAGLQGAANTNFQLSFLKTFIKGYKEYRARLNQSATADPNVPYLFTNEISAGTGSTDPAWVNISYQRLGVGLYNLRLRYGASAIITGSTVDISFSDAKVRCGSFASGSDVTSAYIDFPFNSYNIAGALADSVISFTNVYLKI